MDFLLLKRIVEATLLAAAQPLSVLQLLALLGEDTTVSHEDVARALAELQQDCAERGVELKEVASGFRYQVREDVHPWVARLWTERQTKYSRALLETLALIAYRQPITRAEIEQIRGVAVSSSIVKTLEEREWVRVVGHRDVPGRPALFGTTRHFLDYFNLKSLDELPPLAEIRDLDEFDPQLNLAPIGMDGALLAASPSGAAAADATTDPPSSASGASAAEAAAALGATTDAEEADAAAEVDGAAPPADSPSPPDVPETDSTVLDSFASTTASDDAPEHTA
ncbi:MAG: SMC-Scp complex subunit ScpB [Lysobacterales bacterium]